MTGLPLPRSYDYPLAVLVCGSRNWTDVDAIARDLETLHPDSVVVEGGQRGADRIARQEAYKLGLHVATVPALWDHYYRAAGYRRNTAMMLLGPDIVFAYPLGGPGTAMMIKIAEAAGIPVRIHRP